jgi:hypothetical protein
MKVKSKYNCKKCGCRFSPKSRYQEYCSNCHAENKEMKGGIINMAKKKKQEEKTQNAETKQTEPKTNTRSINADKLEKFFKEELKVDDSESRKIMSNLYTRISERLNNKK